MLGFGPGKRQQRDLSHSLWFVQQDHSSQLYRSFVPSGVSSMLANFIMSYADADALHAALSPDSSTDQHGTYFLPCNLNVNLAFGFGGRVFTIYSGDYIAEVVQGQGSNTCQSKIYGDAGLDVFWKMGTGLLRNVHKLFKTVANIPEGVHFI
jgi:hypothetical protein